MPKQAIAAIGSTEDLAITAPDDETSIISMIKALLAGINPAGERITIDRSHNEIHEGESFEWTYLRPHGSELPNDATFAVVFFVPGPLFPHLTGNVNVGGNSDLLFFEDITASTTGTARASFNMKRPSANTSQLQWWYGAALASSGTLLPETYIPAGRGPNAAGAGQGRDTEIILNTGTWYGIVLTNRSGSAMQFGEQFIWYEEESLT